MVMVRFLIAIMPHLNNLNVELHGDKHTIYISMTRSFRLYSSLSALMVSPRDSSVHTTLFADDNDLVFE